MAEVDDELGLSNEEYQLFGEHLCGHYIAEGKTQEEAVELVLGHLRDPKWKLEVAHQARSQQEMADLLKGFLEEHAPDRVGEADELSTNYTGNERELAAYLRSEFGAIPSITDFDALADHIEVRRAAMDERVRDVTLLGSFLRRFFARFEPWDGSGREEKADLLTEEYQKRETWGALHALLQEHYHRSLELRELFNMMRGGTGEEVVASNLLVTTTMSTPEANGVLQQHQQPLLQEEEKPPEPRNPLDLPPHQEGKRNEGGAMAATRREWLESNAAFARTVTARGGGGRFLRRVARATGTAPCFRIFFALWLACGGLVLLLYSFHFMTFVCWRIFVPKTSGFFPTLGTLCIFLASVFCVSSLLATCSKTFHQWVFLDDAVFFGDEDFSRIALRQREEGEEGPGFSEGGNPIPAHLVPVVPPFLRVTFWGLPTRKVFPREAYVGLLFFATVPVALLYSIVAVLAEGEYVYQAIPRFCEWNITAGVAVHLVLWVHGWMLTVRSKYRHFYEFWRLRKERGGLVEYVAELEDAKELFLHEVGLDHKTVAINLGILALTMLPVILLFWMTSRTKVVITGQWVAAGLATVVILLIIREVIRDEKSSTASPFVILLLCLAFTVLGFVGTAAIDLSAVAMFGLVAVMSQMMLLPHKARACVTVSAREFSERLLGELKERYGDTRVPASRLQRSAEKVAKRLVRHELKHPGDAGDDSASDASASLLNVSDSMEPVADTAWWLPASRTFYALFSLRLQPVSTTAHWTPADEYYGAGNAAEEEDTHDPRRKVQQGVSPFVLLWTMLLFLTASGIVVGMAGEWRQEAAAAPELPQRNSPQLTYPVCSLTWAGLSLTDLAFLAHASYLTNTNDWVNRYDPVVSAQNFSVVPPHGRNLGEVFDPSYGEERTFFHGQEGDGPPINWVHFKGEGETHVVVVRSNLEGRHLMRDVDLWGDSMVFRAMAAVVPVLNFFGAIDAARWVERLGAMKRSLDGGDDARHYIFALGNFVSSLTEAATPEEPVRVVVVGHGTNGALATMVTSFFTSIPSVAFSSPGTVYMGAKLSPNLPFNARSLNIVPRLHPMPHGDKHNGAVQHIRCMEDTPRSCHSMSDILQVLQTDCGTGLFAD